MINLEEIKKLIPSIKLRHTCALEVGMFIFIGDFTTNLLYKIIELDSEKFTLYNPYLPYGEQYHYISNKQDFFWHILENE